MFHSIKQILPTIFDIQKDWRLCLLKNWKSLVGELDCHMRLEKIEGDTLIIGVYEPQWMQELFLLSRVLLNSVNSNLGHNYIRYLRFKLVEKRKFKMEIKNNYSQISNFKYELNCNQKLALTKIHDEQLRDMLQGFLVKCMASS